MHNKLLQIKITFRSKNTNIIVSIPLKVHPKVLRDVPHARHMVGPSSVIGQFTSLLVVRQLFRGPMTLGLNECTFDLKK